MPEPTDETQPVDEPSGARRMYGGRYIADTHIGTGGMATVYRGRDLQLHRSVAIKVMRPGHLHGFDDDDVPRMQERFRKEAESLARLNHRAIVTVYDYGTTDDGEYYLVMEFVDGASLAGMLKGRKRMQPRRTLNVAVQVCRALRYAHRRGLVHRDVKLPNILVTHTDEGEVVKLVDFGLVKLVDEEGPTAHGIILGSTNCMAPEQISGGYVDRRVDLYGLGVVMYRLLTGRYPFQSKSTTEQLAAHLHATVPRFSEVAPELMVPEGLEKLIRRMLAKQPEGRFTNADQVLNELYPLLNIDPDDFVSASLHDHSKFIQPPRPVAQRPRPAPRQPRRILLWVAAVPVVLFALFGASVMGGLTVYWLDPRGGDVGPPTPVEAAPVEVPLAERAPR